MAAPKPVSLDTFAAAQPNPKAKCPVCQLPDAVRAQVEQAHHVHTGTVVSKWLSSVGTPIPAQSVRNHWNAGHGDARP